MANTKNDQKKILDDIKNKIKDKRVILFDDISNHVYSTEIEFLNKKYNYIYRNILGVEMQYCIRSYSILLKASSIEWAYLLIMIIDDIINYDPSTEYGVSEFFNPMFKKNNKNQHFKVLESKTR